MFEALARHWPEYLMEAALLACFMISACTFGVLLQHPSSPARRRLTTALPRRALMGLAMGLTAITLIYSPWGQQSGAHMNPATTLTFFLRGKVAAWDALFYVLAQFAGAAIGVATARLLLSDRLRHESVNHVVTAPGPRGVRAAWLAELAIAFGMMLTVLIVSNDARLTAYTGFFAGALVVLYITFEAPLSGMSLNPARSFGSAIIARRWRAFWVYLTAPLTGMLLASAAYAALPGHNRVYCAKLDHCNDRRCIFDCEFDQLRPAGQTARPEGGAAASSAPVAVESVAAIGMTVANLDQAISFYSDVLTFELVSQTDASGAEFAALQGLPPAASARIARLRLGGELIELTEYASPKGRPFPADSRSNDRWFQHIAIIVSDMAKAYAHLDEQGVQPASNGPQRLPDWNRNAAGIQAYYFRDPDGHFLEVLEFPPDKGDPKWRRPSDKLFLGIDHTAIVVRDTQASLQFYRDVLGFKVVGGSENFGIEQENLNNVPGAHLRITTLRTSAGPGIELLEYLQPRDGRPYPSDAHASDVLHWQTTLLTPAFAPLADRLHDPKYERVSRNAAQSNEPQPATRPALIVRDPDGHALKIEAR